MKRVDRLDVRSPLHGRESRTRGQYLHTGNAYVPFPVYAPMATDEGKSDDIIEALGYSLETPRR